MVRKFIERGKQNFPRYLFYGAFSDKAVLRRHWDIIVSKIRLTGWKFMFSDVPTNLSNISYDLLHREEYRPGSVLYRIGLFRDGFYITVRNDSGHGKIHSDIWFNMCESVFGNKNWSGGWTQEIENVALLTNKITKAIKEFFDETA